MPLTKSKGNMYDWVTHTHTHLGGECPHKCSYCYVQAMAKRFPVMKERYTGKIRIIEKEMDVKYGTGKTIFIEHLNDLWANGVPDKFVNMVLGHCSVWPDNTYVFQTKNPYRYMDFIHRMPPRRILGCTIESSDDEQTARISDTPMPHARYSEMRNLRLQGERLFITIEPILDGNMLKLANYIKGIDPEFVNIGADSKGGNLNEPTAEQIIELIELLNHYGVTIRRKTSLSRILGDKELPNAE